MKGRTGTKPIALVVEAKPQAGVPMDSCGGAEGKKHGGKVSGKKPSKRADKFARGGKIHINPKHKGLLTKEVGKKGLTTGNLKKEIAADKKSGNVAKEKREVFALNAKKFKH